MSIMLLVTMAHKNKLKIMCGDVGNAFPNAPTNEKICDIAGEEFGDRKRFSVKMFKSFC